MLTITSQTLLVALLVFSLFANNAPAQQPQPTPDIGFARLEEAARRIAAHVSKHLQEDNIDSLNVGDFTAPPRLKTSGGAGVRQLIIKAIQAEKISISDNAPRQLTGAFKESEPDDQFAGEIGLRVTCALLDARDSELDKFTIRIFGAAALQITGGTAELPSAASNEERREEQNKRLQEPRASLVGDETRAALQSDYGVEVAVRQGADLVAKRPVLTAGRAFVPLHKGETYIVRLHNRSKLAAAVMLTIDGLSIFTFSTEGNFGSQVVVPPGKTVEVTGWYFTQKDTRAFEITSYPDSAAGKKGVPSASTGVITATFAAAWSPDESPPTDEPATRSFGGATGIGEKTGQIWKPVKFVIGRPRSVVSVRYNREE